VNERVVSIGTGRKAVSQQTASNARPVCPTRKAACTVYPLGIDRCWPRPKWARREVCRSRTPMACPRADPTIRLGGRNRKAALRLAHCEWL